MHHRARASRSAGPLALLLSLKRPTANAAVTVVHTGVPDWPSYTRRADIVVAAAGVPGHHHARACDARRGGRRWRASRYEGKRILPDVDEACAEVAGWITPRLGGVGPTTRGHAAAQRVARGRAPGLSPHPAGTISA